MNLTKKLTAAITGAVLAGTIGLGAIGLGATASAADATTPSATSVQAKCDREPKITERYEKVHAQIAQRLTNLQARHDRAVANGHDKVATRLQRVIDRLTKADHRITARYDRYETWVDAHCNS